MGALSLGMFRGKLDQDVDNITVLCVVVEGSASQGCSRVNSVYQGRSEGGSWGARDPPL